MRRPGSATVVFLFDGGAGDCPAALQKAVRVVSWNGRLASIEAWLDGQGVNKAHVIGQAAGGEDAFNFAMTHPERSQSLTLSETSAGMRHSRVQLRAVTAPVLVVAGGTNSLCPSSAARKLAARFSNGRAAEIAEAARSPFAETPEEWCDVVLKFLASVTRQLSEGSDPVS